MKDVSGKNNPFYGKKHTEESKKKIGEAHIGIKLKPRTEEYRKKISEALKGRIFTKEWKEKLSLAQKGKKKNKFSEEHKKKISVSLSKYSKNRTLIHLQHLSEAQRGEKSRNWKGGVTELQILIRKNFKYKEWRKLVFERDKYTCQWCSENKKHDFNAHHIKSFKNILVDNNIKTLQQALECNELWDIKNGITLCIKCHDKTK